MKVPAFYIEVLQKYLFFIALRHRQHSRAEFIPSQEPHHKRTTSPQEQRKTEQANFTSRPGERHRTHHSAHREHYTSSLLNTSAGQAEESKANTCGSFGTSAQAHRYKSKPRSEPRASGLHIEQNVK
ncbi:MAG: hypothetical protein II440_02765 [Clostridia bacterium]|nr:hypothetical protein [Clostridia bacterium]